MIDPTGLPDGAGSNHTGRGGGEANRPEWALFRPLVGGGSSVTPLGALDEEPAATFRRWYPACRPEGQPAPGSGLTPWDLPLPLSIFESLTPQSPPARSKSGSRIFVSRMTVQDRSERHCASPQDKPPRGKQQQLCRRLGYRFILSFRKVKSRAEGAFLRATLSKYGHHLTEGQ
jgi:hypothetical protein